MSLNKRTFWYSNNCLRETQMAISNLAVSTATIIKQFKHGNDTTADNASRSCLVAICLLFISSLSWCLRLSAPPLVRIQIKKTEFLGIKKHKAGSVKAYGREPKSGLGRVFNFKLGHFVMYAMAWYIHKHVLTQSCKLGPGFVLLAEVFPCLKQLRIWNYICNTSFSLKLTNWLNKLVLHNSRLGMLVRFKHSSLLDPFILVRKIEVLWICAQGPYFLHNSQKGQIS